MIAMYNRDHVNTIKNRLSKLQERLNVENLEQAIAVYCMLGLHQVDTGSTLNDSEEL